MQMTQEKYDDEQEYWATQEQEYEALNAKDRGKWFNDGLTKAFKYAESGDNLKISKEGVCVDAYLEGFLDGIAYFITEGRRND